MELLGFYDAPEQVLASICQCQVKHSVAVLVLKNKQNLSHTTTPAPFTFHVRVTRFIVIVVERISILETNKGRVGVTLLKASMPFYLRRGRREFDVTFMAGEEQYYYNKSGSRKQVERKKLGRRERSGRTNLRATFGEAVRNKQWRTRTNKIMVTKHQHQ